MSDRHDFWHEFSESVDGMTTCELCGRDAINHALVYGEDSV